MLKSMDDLINLTYSGLYALVNDDKKKVYVGYSVNTLRSIAGILDSVACGVLGDKELQKDLATDSFTINKLEECKQSYLQKVIYSYWIDYYKQLGYSLYRSYNPVTYKPKVYIDSDMRVHVKILNRQPTRPSVGIFKTVAEAEEFIREIYEPMKYKQPVYAFNKLTRDYIKSEGWNTESFYD